MPGQEHQRTDVAQAKDVPRRERTAPAADDVAVLEHELEHLRSHPVIRVGAEAESTLGLEALERRE